MEQRTYEPGELIFREGEESDCGYIVVTGRVEIFKRMQGGTILLATLDEGDIFGEMGIISDEPRSASAAAETVVTVNVLSRDQLAELVQPCHENVVLIIKTLMERIREANQKLSRLAQKQAQFQLADNSAVPQVKSVTILPLTQFLKDQMQSSGVRTTSLPFRIGCLPEGQEMNPLDWNNFFVKGADPSIMSRNHFAIQQSPEGLQVVDRGSKSGTIVNGEQVGGGSPEYSATLNYGENDVVAGPPESPYRFCVIWE